MNINQWVYMLKKEEAGITPASAHLYSKCAYRPVTVIVK
jgi:hypothetical protein